MVSNIHCVHETLFSKCFIFQKGDALVSRTQKCPICLHHQFNTSTLWQHWNRRNGFGVDVRFTSPTCENGTHPGEGLMFHMNQETYSPRATKLDVRENSVSRKLERTRGETAANWRLISRLPVVWDCPFVSMMFPWFRWFGALRYSVVFEKWGTSFLLVMTLDWWRARRYASTDTSSLVYDKRQLAVPRVPSSGEVIEGKLQSPKTITLYDLIFSVKSAGQKKKSQLLQIWVLHYLTPRITENMIIAVGLEEVF